MAFKLKPHSEIFGLHDATSEFGTPVIIKDDLEEGIQAEAGLGPPQTLLRMQLPGTARGSRGGAEDGGDH